MKNVCKSLWTSQFWNIWVASLKIWNPDNIGLKITFFKILTHRWLFFPWAQLDFYSEDISRLFYFHFLEPWKQNACSRECHVTPSRRRRPAVDKTAQLPRYTLAPISLRKYLLHTLKLEFKKIFDCFFRESFLRLFTMKKQLTKRSFEKILTILGGIRILTLYALKAPTWSQFFFIK